ncbi:hypothetical protein ACFE04_021455 [Oxalis oulophora]
MGKTIQLTKRDASVENIVFEHGERRLQKVKNETMIVGIEIRVFEIDRAKHEIVRLTSHKLRLGHTVLALKHHNLKLVDFPNLPSLTMFGIRGEDAPWGI